MSCNAVQHAQDGSFYMEFGDFCTYFGRCKIVDVTCFNRLSEDSLCRIDCVASYWVAGQTAGGRLGPATFECNPKFELTGQGGEVLLTVYQPDTRHTCIAPVEKELGDPMMDVYLYFGAKGQRPVEVAKLLGGFDGDRLSTARVRVEAGVQYHVVATAGAAGEQGAFAVTACGNCVQMKPCPLAQAPPQYAAAMAARGACLYSVNLNQLCTSAAPVHFLRNCLEITTPPSPLALMLRT